MLPQRRQCRPGSLLRRIEEGQVAAEDQVALVLFRLRFQVAVGHGQDAEAVGAELVELLLEVGGDDVLHWVELSIKREVGAALIDRLRGAFADEAVLAVRSLHHHRHHFAREVERNLIDLRVIGQREMRLKFGMVENGPVHQVFQSGLEMAVEVSHRQHVFIVFEHDVAVLFKDDAVHGQRAGLVGAKHVHGAEVLDRVQALDDDPLARHGHGAFGQADRHDHRQHFRGQPDRHRQSEFQGIHPAALRGPIDDEHQRHHHDHKPDHQPGELADAAVEGGRRVLVGD